MRRLLLSTAALLFLAAPAFAQPHGNQGHGNQGQGNQGQGNRGEEHSNRVGKASVAPQVQDRAQAELRNQGRGRGEEQRGEIRGNAPPRSAMIENRGDRIRDRDDRDNRDRDRNNRIENRNDARQASREFRPDRRPDWNRDLNRDGRTDYRRDYNGPRHDFSGFRDYHRAFRAPRRFRADFYRRPAGWYERRWVYGEFLPSAFWARDYWIVDFEAYDLPPPPYGAIWVRVASDALLIDEDSGEIITVAYDVFY